MESMSVGQITVATRNSGFDQLIVDGASGWLSIPNDPESLLAATEKALAMGEDARRQMGRAAQERIAQLNPGCVAETHLAFYRETIEETAAKRQPTRAED
jgi:glycosyltransferase involved in cell wall biosynthesis